MNLPTKITVARLFLTLIIILLLCVPFSSFGFHFPKYDINGVIVEINYITDPADEHYQNLEYIELIIHPILYPLILYH